MAITPTIRVTDDSTPADLAEAIGHINHRAKRSPHIIGTRDHPTEWDRRHQLLDAMLTDWQARSARP